jgi:hypothetical protein
MSAARLLRRAWLGGGGDESNESGKSSAVFLLAIIRQVFSRGCSFSLSLNEHMLSGQRWRFFWGDDGSGSVCLFVFFRLDCYEMELMGRLDDWIRFTSRHELSQSVVSINIPY